MTTEERSRRRFSEQFRKEQVVLIERGELTVAEVSRLYEVKAQNVRRWLSRYGTKALPGLILVSDGKEYDRIGALEKENRKLLELIGKQQVELVYKDKLLSLSREKLGEGFEKK